MTLQEFQNEIASLQNWAQHGCRDSGCRIEKPKGQCTNGGCNCSPRDFSDQLFALAAELEKHGRSNWTPQEAKP